MKYKKLTERARRVLLGLLLRYAEYAPPRLERAARALIEDLC